MLQYNLQVGKTFNVVAQTKIKVDFLKSVKIFEDEISFIVTCKVAAKRKDVYTLDCVLSWLDANSFMYNFWKNAVGDRFIVRKDTRGQIIGVSRGKKIKEYLLGLPMKNVLLWFGAILSGTGINGNEGEWVYDDGKVFYHFSNSKEKKANGNKLPLIKINGSWSNENIFNPVTDFRCSGEVLFDKRSGRIAVSKKNLHASLLKVFDFDVRMKAGETQYLS